LPGDKSDRSLLICGLKTAESQGSRFGISPKIRKQVYIKSMETSKKYLKNILDLNGEIRVLIFVILSGCLYRLLTSRDLKWSFFSYVLLETGTFQLPGGRYQGHYQLFQTTGVEKNSWAGWKFSVPIAEKSMNMSRMKFPVLLNYRIPQIES